MANFGLDNTIIEMINNAFRSVKAAPLVLGATETGTGGPVGGFIGKLPQRRVAFDTVEAESSGIPTSGKSIITNLDRIRYRLAVLESGGGTFLALSDAPDSYIGFSGYVVRVNDTEDALEFAEMSGGTTLPTFDPYKILHTNADGELSSDNNIWYKEEHLGYSGQMYHGSDTIQIAGHYMEALELEGASAHRFMIVMSDTLSHSNRRSAIRGGGTLAAPTETLSGMIIQELRGFGIDAPGAITGGATTIQQVADGDFTPSSHPAKIDIYTTPSGSTALSLAMTIQSDGNINIPSGKEYRIGGIAIGGSSDVIPKDGWVSVSDTWTVQTQAYTNDPAAGASIVLNVASTSKFSVDDTVIVSSSAGAERALITAVILNTSVTVDRLQLNHTTTNPLIIHTKITAPSGADTIYTPGTKIRLKQGGGYKYFYVIDNTSTLVSLQAGDDYYLTNSAITDIAYSYIESPAGFPPIFNWTPFNTGFSVQPTGTYKFKIRGGLISLFVGSGVGTSNATTFGIPPPFAFVGIGSNTMGITLGGVDNGVSITAPGRVIIITNNNIRIDKAFGASNGWTASGNKSTAFAVETPYR